MRLKTEGWLVTEDKENYYLYPSLPHRRTECFYHKTGGDSDCSGFDEYTTYSTHWDEKKTVILTIKKEEIENFNKSAAIYLPFSNVDEMQRGVMEIEFNSEGIIFTKWKKLKNDEIDDLDRNIVTKKIIEIFQRHCFSKENGWIKPRDFSDIGKDVSQDIFDEFEEMGWLKKDYNKKKTIQ